jgi:flagellar basal-body rod protein FlgC
VFAAVYGRDSLVDGQSPGARVQVLDVLESSEPSTRAYEPDNPLANAEGVVFYPNVNPVAEMTDMMSASRAFETNVEVLHRVKGMQASLLKLGEG